jgi:hypothetical protein
VGRYFLVTEDEAHDAFGADYEKYWNEQVEGYEVGYYTTLLLIIQHLNSTWQT